MELRGWNVVDAERGILWREYQFSKGAYATMLVFRGPDGLVVVSPGNGLEGPDYDVLSEFGEVRALVANNTYHHLGQAAWRARFPEAESYAAPEVLAKLRGKASGIAFRSAQELALPPGGRLHVLPGFRTGELMFTLATSMGSLWYTGDLLTNIERTPGPPFSWIMSLTDSAPGFRLFKLGVWFFVKDRAALRQRMATLLADDPPAVIVPSHGPALSGPGVAADTRTQLAKL